MNQEREKSGQNGAAPRPAIRASRRASPNDERFAQVFEAAPSAMVLTDGAGRIEMVNLQVERIFGYSRTDLLGHPIEMLVPRRLRRQHAGERKSYSGEPSRREMGSGRDLLAVRKDGSEFAVEIGLNPIDTPDGGKILAAIIDITERKAAEQELREREVRLRSVIETAPDAVIVADERGIIESFSPAAERLFGFAAAEAVGRSIKLLMPPPYCDGDDSLIARYLARRDRRIGGADRTVIGRRKNGETFPIELSVGEFRLGKRRFLTGFARDLSERQQAEARLAQERAAFEHRMLQSQKLEAIGQLTGGLAHDFNNLLGIIMGSLELVAPQLTPQSDAGELVNNAIDAAKRGADLTRRLLIFARQQPLQSDYIELTEVVGGMSKLLARLLGENIEITLDIAPDTWPVIGDAAQLQTSLANLATNARDAMPKGGRLTIVTRNRRLDAHYTAEHPQVVAGEYAAIEVGDTGTGMPPEVLAHIFEPFYTTKERGKGTGLGLAMVFGFIKQSGGHINVYSEPGFGTTFRLYLPRARASDDALEANGEAPLAAPSAGETVLAVEDDAALRRVAVRQLRELGYRVLEADSALAALTVLETHKADLLFSDTVISGGVDGFELAREVIRRWPEIKVVLTSGLTGPLLHATLASLGHTVRLLAKPYQRAELARVLRDTLGK